MINQPKKAVERAVEFLRSALSQRHWQPDEILPPVRILAASASVSLTSMVKALAAVKTEGLIYGSERSRFRIGKGNTPPSVPQHTGSLLWQSKRTDVEKDILSGAFATDGRLPSYKELQKRYSTCYATMRKIIRALIQDGIIRPEGRTFSIIDYRPQSRRRHIAFLTLQVLDYPQSALNLQEFTIIELLEKECQRRGFQLKVYEIDFYDSKDVRLKISQLQQDESTAGYILDVWWYDSVQLQQHYLDVLTVLSHYKTPVAILDEIGGFDLPFEFSSNPLLQHFCFSDAKAGAGVARLLLSLGDTRAAYFSMARIRWAIMRLKGITEQFSSDGTGRHVASFFSQESGITLLHILTLADFTEAECRKVIGINHTEAQIENSYRSYLAYRRNPPNLPLSPATLKAVQEYCKAIADLARRKTDRAFFNSACHAMLETIDSCIFSNVAERLFEQALTDKSITAWICANDRIGFEALRFLEQQHRAVPRDISVISFDNQPVKAFRAQLTTYDFNAHAFVHRMLSFIARPPRPRGRYRHASVEIEGSIIMRRTVSEPCGSLFAASEPAILDE